MLVAMVAHGPGPGVALFLTNMPVFFFFFNTDGSVQCFFTTKYISVQYRFSIYSLIFLFSSFAKIICLM